MDAPAHSQGNTVSVAEQPHIPHQRAAASDPAQPNTAATRRLCAGVYLDPGFRDRVLRDVYNDNKRHTAPSYGFDPIPVLRHAWHSWALDTAQHLVVTVVMAMVIIWRPLIALFVGSIVLVWWAGRQLHELLKAYWRDLFDFSGRRMSHGRERASKFFSLIFAAALALLGGTAVVLATGSHTGWLMRGDLIEALLVFLVPMAAAAIVAAARQLALDHVHEEPARDRTIRLPRRLATIQAHQERNFTVYDGFRPFIGSGSRVGGWSFPQRLVPPQDLLEQLRPKDEKVLTVEYKTPPFRTEQLVAHLREQIRSLSQEPDPEIRLPGLNVSEHVFIEGTHARAFLDAFRTDEAAATKQVMTSPTDAARHYLACHIESWGGEVFTSVLVHVSLQGRTLYLEFSTYALTPTCRDFKKIDEIGETGVGARWRAARSSIRRTPELLLAPRNLGTALRLLLGARRAHHDLTLTARRGVNCGARFSLREEAVWQPTERDDPQARARRSPDIDYFQLGDINKHSQIIERRLLAAVADFLTAKDVDTSEFWQRATTILNNSVVSMGSGNTIIKDTTFGSNTTVNPNPSPSP